MPRYKRVPGGEKNVNSGKRWTKEELKEVLNLYFHELNRGQSIHENNIHIQRLASKLERTVRGTEAQLLMFRNLDRYGDYSWGHMSQLCKQLWFEYLDQEAMKL